MDVFTRMVRGWQVSRHLTQPDIETLATGIKPKRARDSPQRPGRSVPFDRLCVDAHQSVVIDISLARRGRPWDNGYAERLIRTLKEEEVHLNEYDDIIDAKQRIEHFILQVYNHKRPHSALGYLTPVEFEQQLLV